MSPESIDPWSQTVILLGVLSGFCENTTYDRSKRVGSTSTRAQRNDWSSVSIRVTGRPTSTTATVTWCDVSSCFYGDQLWRFSVARTSGVCAFSGRAIACGEAVYHPRTGNRRPLNAGAMILASVIEQAIEC